MANDIPCVYCCEILGKNHDMAACDEKRILDDLFFSKFKRELVAWKDRHKAIDSRACDDHNKFPEEKLQDLYRRMRGHTDVNDTAVVVLTASELQELLDFITIKNKASKL